MDDDRNKSLDYQEFRKGIQDYGLDLEDEVSIGACHMCQCRFETRGGRSRDLSLM